MKAKKLNSMIPYAKGGAEKILSMKPYPDIELRLPGRHAMDTNPIGGDFCVCVSDINAGWYDHQFTHTDLFIDIESKHTYEPDAADCLMGAYLEVLLGEDPEIMRIPGGTRFPGLDYVTFLRAVQCLAIAEHRRYHQYESSFGGRYLPFRFASGIVDGLWTAADCAGYQNQGLIGIGKLERLYGIPHLTKRLMENE